MTARKPLSRDGRLLRLKAFGLFILGGHTLYQIAEKIGIAAENPSTAAGRARTRIESGWRIIVESRVPRWDAYWSQEFPFSEWQTLHGARLWTHGRKPAEPPKPEPTAFDRLLMGIWSLEDEARQGGFHDAATGLKNMAAALCYNDRMATDKKRKAVNR